MHKANCELYSVLHRQQPVTTGVAEAELNRRFPNQNTLMQSRQGSGTHKQGDDIQCNNIQ